MKVLLVALALLFQTAQAPTPILDGLLKEIQSLKVPPPPAVSSEGTTMPPAARLIDAKGDTWTFDPTVKTPVGSAQIRYKGASLNGYATSLTFRGGKVYAAGTDGLEYVWTGAPPWVATGVVLTPPVVPPVVVPPIVPAGHGAVPTEADFTLVGAFDLPAMPGDNSRITGFGIRYVNGVRHFLALGYNGLVELVDPGTASAAPYPVAAFPTWGGNYGRAGRTQASLPLSRPSDPSSTGLQASGVYWDDVLHRGYVNYYDPYGGRAPDYSWGGFTINETTHTTTEIGCWGIKQNQELGNTGITAIPAWFTAAFLAPGQRLGVGFGDPLQSSLNGDLGSDGPTVTAFAPDTGTNKCPPAPAFTAGTTLLAFGNGFQPGPYTAPTPARTSLVSYRDGMNGWNPKNGVGYFIRQSIGGQSCVWVDTAARSGFVCLWWMGNGSFDAVVQASPAPTLIGRGGTMQLSTTTLADGTALQSGDVLVIQTDPAGFGGGNCLPSCEVFVSGVNGNSVSFNDTGGGLCTAGGPGPLISGRVFSSGTFYCNATIQAMRGRHRWFVYDPADLGAVAKGTKTSDAPDAAHEWEGVFDTPAWTAEPTYGHNGSGDLPKTSGMAFDPVAKQLFVTIDHAGVGNGCPPGAFTCGARVYVYAVP